MGKKWEQIWRCGTPEGNGASAYLWIGKIKIKGFTDLKELQKTLQYHEKGFLEDALSLLVRGLDFHPQDSFYGIKTC